MEQRQFTLRMPGDLYDQIEVRATVLKRSVNAEVVSLLEWSIDRQVAADGDTFKMLRERVAEGATGTEADVAGSPSQAIPTHH